MQFLEELKKLELPNDRFAVFGSGPMAIRGFHLNHDIDIIVDTELWGELKNKHLKGKQDDHLQLTKNVEAYYNWPNFDVDELIKEAEMIDGIRFVKLENVLEWKKTQGREKDMRHIKLIEDYLIKSRV